MSIAGVYLDETAAGVRAPRSVREGLMGDVDLKRITTN